MTDYKEMYQEAKKTISEQKKVIKSRKKPQKAARLCPYYNCISTLICIEF